MRQHSVIREGLIAGAIGATAVAVWFLLVDVIAGNPLYTPTLLGTALLSILGPAPAGENPLIHTAFYTVFHYAAFFIVGMIAVAVVHWAEREPAVLAGVLVLFVAFQLAFYLLVTLLSQFEILGSLAWYQVGAANLLAAGLMGWYLWRTHPALGPEFDYALAGGESAGSPGPERTTAAK